MSFQHEARSLGGGDSLDAGRLEITAIDTTGHTDHHLAYLVRLPDAADPHAEGDLAVCTGGSLLVNTTGRTDLLGLELAEKLAVRSGARSGAC